MLFKSYNNNKSIYEIGVDEVGRGPMFGRLYTAAVILPYPDESDFDFSCIKDSKKFTSNKKLLEVYNYIINNAIDYQVDYSEHTSIDRDNIRNSTQLSMTRSIDKIINNNNNNSNNNSYYILIDGNYFKPYTYFDNIKDIINEIPHTTIEGGDNKYCAIAAASIIAKVERDKYIAEMCEKYKKLDTYYGLLKNKGYGTKQHMDAIKTYGISPWHRKTFGLCKTAIENSLEFYIE